MRRNEKEMTLQHGVGARAGGAFGGAVPTPGNHCLQGPNFQWIPLPIHRTNQNALLFRTVFVRDRWAVPLSGVIICSTPIYTIGICPFLLHSCIVYIGVLDMMIALLYCRYFVLPFTIAALHSPGAFPPSRNFPRFSIENRKFAPCFLHFGSEMNDCCAAFSSVCTCQHTCKSP